MIHTLTLNPAVDKLLVINEFRRDTTNRILETCNSVGGKGTHVSINLSLLNKESKAFGILFGENGETIKDILKQYPKIDVNMLHFKEGNSRTNYVIIEIDKNNTCTLITEQGHFITKDVSDELIQLLKKKFNFGDFLVISGHAGNTEIPGIYNFIMDSVKDKRPKVFLDTSSEDLKSGLTKKPFLVKPNEYELSQVMGREISTEEDILEGIDYISNQGVRCIVVSRGEKGSIASYDNTIYKVIPPRVNVVSTIGCGDALLSGLVYGFDEEMEFEDILRFATAISAAAAESKFSVGFDYSRAMSLLDDVRIIKF